MKSDILLVILQIVAVIVNVYIAFAKKKNVYITTFAFNFVNLCIYIYLGDITTIISYILISLRSFLYIYKDKLKVRYLPLLFIVLHIVFGIFTMENYIQILSIIAPCLTCMYMWISEDEQQLRLGNIGVASIWCLYNGLLGLYGLVLSRVITIVANIISYNIKKKDIGV